MILRFTRAVGKNAILHHLILKQFSWWISDSQTYETKFHGRLFILLWCTVPYWCTDK